MAAQTSKKATTFALSLFITPRPSTLTESHAILQHIKSKFGRVISFYENKATLAATTPNSRSFTPTSSLNIATEYEKTTKPTVPGPSSSATTSSSPRPTTAHYLAILPHRPTPSPSTPQILREPSQQHQNQNGNGPENHQQDPTTSTAAEGTTSFTVPVYANVKKPRDLDPFNIRGLAGRKEWPGEVRFRVVVAEAGNVGIGLGGIRKRTAQSGARDVEKEKVCIKLNKAEGEPKPGDGESGVKIRWGGRPVGGRESTGDRAGEEKKKDDQAEDTKKPLKFILENTGAPAGIARGLAEVLEREAAEWREIERKFESDGMRKKDSRGKRLRMDSLLKFNDPDPDPDPDLDSE